MRDTCERKRLKGKKHVLDHMGSTELAANLFCATQTEEKLRRENMRNKDHAIRIHNPEGPPDRSRTGQQFATESACGLEHQEGGRPRKETTQGRAERGTPKRAAGSGMDLISV